jgi:hypothetical protein
VTGGNYRSNYYGPQYAHAASPDHHRSLTAPSQAHTGLTSAVESAAAGVALRRWQNEVAPGGTLPWGLSVESDRGFS